MRTLHLIEYNEFPLSLLKLGALMDRTVHLMVALLATTVIFSNTSALAEGGNTKANSAPVVRSSTDNNKKAQLSDGDQGEDEEGFQERHWTHHGSERHGNHGGVRGMGPQRVLAEILLIPSLSKDQQGRLRVLYLNHRQQIASRASSVSSQLSSNDRPRNRGQKHRRKSAGMGEAILAGLVTDSKAPLLVQKNQENDKNRSIGTDNFWETMIVEQLNFTRDILAVLTNEQRKELREIGIKTGSPDYFVKLNEDMKKLNIPAK